MTENDVKRLNRSELLQLLIKQTKRIEELEAELAKANKQLDDRAIMVDEAGSIAEASLKLNDVFGSAQAAAEQYLENIKLLNSRQEEILKKRDEESRQRAAQIINDAEKKAARRIKEADEYWGMLSQKLESFYDEHVGLRELLQTATRKKDHERKEN